MTSHNPTHTAYPVPQRLRPPGSQRQTSGPTYYRVRCCKRESTADVLTIDEAALLIAPGLTCISPRDTYRSDWETAWEGRHNSLNEAKRDGQSVLRRYQLDNPGCSFDKHEGFHVGLDRTPWCVLIRIDAQGKPNGRCEVTIVKVEEGGKLLWMY